MSINIIAKGFELTDSIKEFSVTEAEKALKIIHFPVNSFKISISSVHKKHLFSTDCNVSFNGHIKSISVSKSGDDLYSCIVESISTVVEIADKEHKKHITAKRRAKRPEFKEENFEED